MKPNFQLFLTICIYLVAFSFLLINAVSLNCIISRESISQFVLIVGGTFVIASWTVYRGTYIAYKQQAPWHKMGESFRKDFDLLFTDVEKNYHLEGPYAILLGGSYAFIGLIFLYYVYINNDWAVDLLCL